jgi:hypothetical protein
MNTKKIFLSLMAVATLMLVAGDLTPSLAQFGGWGRGNSRDRWEDRGRRSRDQQDCDVYGNPRNGRNGRYDDSGYGNGRYGGFRNEEQEKGYRDGLRRGREDYQSNRIPDPNNSSHYRKGNADYRVGFRRGYDDGYPSRYSRRNRW